MHSMRQSSAEVTDGANAPAALLPSGNILFAASPQPAYTVGTHFFVFTPGNTITQVADDAYAAEIAPFYGFMLVLPTGQILFNGRVGNLEVYNDPNPPNPAWAPVIGSVAATLSTGATWLLLAMVCLLAAWQMMRR